MNSHDPNQRADRTLRCRPGRGGRQSAFTLVEMLVVVAVIVILLGLAAAMGPAILAKGAEQTTKARLQTLQGMYEGYLSITGQSNEGGRAVANMQQFIAEAQTIEGLKASLNALGDGLTEPRLYLPKWNSDEQQWEYVSEKALTVFDGWDNAIFLKAGDGITGKGQAGQEARYFMDPPLDDVRVDKRAKKIRIYPTKLPDQGQAYFASPGPNKQWGAVDFRPMPPDSVLTDDDFKERHIRGYDPDSDSDIDWNFQLDQTDDGGLTEEVLRREQDNLYGFELR